MTLNAGSEVQKHQPVARERWRATSEVAFQPARKGAHLRGRNLGASSGKDDGQSPQQEEWEALLTLCCRLREETTWVWGLGT